MRKSSEFRDDIAMNRRISQLLGVAECLVEPHRAILIGE
jgi:hypothetical protein